MAITIQHGSISSALGLAQKAGRGQRARQVAADDLAFIGLMQDAQADADRNYANEISLALGAQEAQANLNLKADQLRQQSEQDATLNALRQQQAAVDNANSAARIELRRQALEQGAARVDQGQQKIEQREDSYDTRQLAIDQLPPEVQEVVRATGRMPYQPTPRPANMSNDPDIQRLKFELDNLKTRYENNERAKNSYGQSSIKVAAGKHDQRYADLEAASAKLMAAMQAKEAEVIARMQGFASPQPAVPQGTVNQMIRQQGTSPSPAPQSAPAQQPRIVAVAVNPQTGQKVGFDANTGQWVPVP